MTTFTDDEDNFTPKKRSYGKSSKRGNGELSSGLLLFEYLHHPVEERIFEKRVYQNGQLKERVIYLNSEVTIIHNSSGTYYEEYVYQDDVLVAQITTDGQKQFIHTDHKGSTSLITDINGNVLESTFYEPFGSVIEGGKLSRYDFEGKEFDSTTRSYDFGFRPYNSDIGKYGKPDTLIEPYNPQSLNRYSFEGNSPYNNVDPDGHFFFLAPIVYAIVEAVIVTAAAVAASYAVGYAAGAAASVAKQTKTNLDKQKKETKTNDKKTTTTKEKSTAQKAKEKASNLAKAAKNVNLKQAHQTGKETGGELAGAASLALSAQAGIGSSGLSTSKSLYKFSTPEQLTKDLGVEAMDIGKGKLKWTPNEKTRIFYHPGHLIPPGGKYTPYEQEGHFSVTIMDADRTRIINPNNPNSFGQHNFLPGDEI